MEAAKEKGREKPEDEMDVEDRDKDDQKKKKKKNKKRKKSQDKEVQEEKTKEAIKNSFIHQLPNLTAEEKQIYAEAENNSMKVVCTNLPVKITSQELFNYFNTLIGTMNPELADPPPIKDIVFDKGRTFAIMELSQRRLKDFFRSHSDFSYIDGKTIFKVMKSKYFFEEKFSSNSTTKKIEASTVGVSTADNKVYLGGLPISFSDQEVRKICETFGKLKSFNMAKERKVSKGYCFFEYENPDHTDKAIQSLNGLAVADRKLKCSRATLSNKAFQVGFSGGSAGIVEEVQRKPANHQGSYLLSYELIKDPFVQLTLRNHYECKTPSRVVQFLNMFSPEDLFDEETVYDITVDLEDECSKYGPIEKIVIPRPDPTCGYAVPSVGKAFVKFKYIIPAKRARLGISGKVYNKRTVVTSFYSEEKFNMKQYLIKA